MQKFVGKFFEIESFLVNALLHLRLFVKAAEAADQMNDIEQIARCYKTAQQFDVAAANEISQRYAS